MVWRRSISLTAIFSAIATRSFIAYLSCWKAISRPVYASAGETMTILNVPYHLPFPRIAHQGDKAIDAMHELAVGHRDKEREHDAQMQRQQRSHRRRIPAQQQGDARQ